MKGETLLLILYPGSMIAYGFSAGCVVNFRRKGCKIGKVSGAKGGRDETRRNKAGVEQDG